jgi:hypothetical protein
MAVVACFLSVATGCSVGGTQTLKIAGQWIEREFAVAPHWRTVDLRCPADGWRLRTKSDELCVELANGQRIQGGDWQLLGIPEQRERGDERFLTVRLATEKVARLQARITYRLHVDQAWAYKEVVLSGPAGVVVSRVDLEPMTVKPAPKDHEGKGMPILVGGRCWFGVEYPASENKIRAGRLALAHYPGRDLGDGELVCKTAVCGMARPGQTVALAFEDYLDATALPPRPFLHYNSWYDLRSAELTPQRLLEVYEGFEKSLLKPYDLRMDAVVIDDGWQEARSIWQPRKDLYPDGFGPLARELESRGTRLGLWMPLSGFNLDVDWGVQQGYEKSSGGRWYCLAAPRFNAAMRDATARLIREGDLSYYKHDFNFLSCQAEGHGHLATGPHGHEANVDRTIELLRYERQLQPGIFLNVTSGMWFSPWWLMDADSIWGAFPGDTGYERSWPQLTRREWEMSFRDVHLYRMYRQQLNNLFPISRLMTHGITQGRYNMLGGENEPLREWADSVMMYFGRGVQLQELYLSPERMREDMWKAVGTAIRWAQRRHKVLARTQMIGGNPAHGEPYGFIHWLGNEGIWVLRNPALDEKPLAVPIGQGSGYRGNAKQLYGAVTYPYFGPLPHALMVGKDCDIALPPASVVVVEVRPRSWGKAIIQPAAKARGHATVSKTEDTVRVGISGRVKARAVRDLRLYVLLRGGATGEVGIDCPQAVGRHVAAGPGWQLEVMDIKPSETHVQAAVVLPSKKHKPFAARRGRIEAWLMFEVQAELAKLESPPADLPWAIADGWRRRSAKIANIELRPEQRSYQIASDQLGEIKAARLHLEVFGVNAGEYADKWVILNGRKVDRVPFNDQDSLDKWEEKVIELGPEQMKNLKVDNTVVLTNETGDCYKVRNLALAVQLPDGSWVESKWDEGVYCSVAGWLYSEGEVFQGQRSREVHLRLPVREK